MGVFNGSKSLTGRSVHSRSPNLAHPMRLLAGLGQLASGLAGRVLGLASVLDLGDVCSFCDVAV